MLGAAMKLLLSAMIALAATLARDLKPVES
jgi:hypothetical protein